MRRITYLLALALIFLLPWEDSVSTSGWGSLARVMGFVVAASWLATVLIEGRFRKPSVFHLFVLLFFLWNVVSAFWSQVIANTIQRITTYGQIFLLMLVFWEIFQTARALMAALQAYVFGAYVLVIGLIYNYLNGIVAVAYQGRFSAPGVNAVDLALMLMLGLPVALNLFLVGTPGKTQTLLKLMNLAYIPLAIYSIILTGSRTSLIAIIPFGVYLAATHRIRLQRKIVVFVLLPVVLLILLPFVPQAVIARLGTVGVSIQGADLGGRVDLWREAIAILAEHPTLGIGGGAMEAIIGTAVHNTYLSVAAETGFIGLVLFLSILEVVVFQAVRLARGSSGLWLTIFMTWAIGVLSLSWEFRKLTWLFFSLVVIAGSLTSELKAEKATTLIFRGIAQPLEMPESEMDTKGAW